MADNQDRLKAFEELVGKEKAAEVLATAEAMAEKANAFLASKEQTEEVKTETVATVADDTATKELKELLVSMKEAQEKGVTEMTLALKEQSEATQKAIAELTEKNAKLQGDVAEAQKAFALLMGIQPKANLRGFKASEQGDEPNLTKEQEKTSRQVEKSVKTGDDWLSGVAEFVISGTKADAVGA